MNGLASVSIIERVFPEYQEPDGYSRQKVLEAHEKLLRALDHQRNQGSYDILYDNKTGDVIEVVGAMAMTIFVVDGINIPASEL